MSNGCPSPCAKCGQQSCVCCDPSVLNQPRIFNPTVSGGIFTGGTLNAPTINGGTATGQSIVGATIDCTTIGCTQPPGTCDASLATTGYVCTALTTLVNSGNPAFCAEVINCVNLGGITCAIVDTCLSAVPGIISTSAAFGPGAQATTLLAGVLEIATQAEIEAGACALTIDPCTLAAVFSTASTITPFWAAFSNAVSVAIAGAPGFCAAVFACGAAPLLSPVFTGIPTAPTAGGGDNSTQLATTAFVQQELVSLLVPSVAFCAAVTTCGFAPLASPTFTGDPTAPTAALGDNDTSIATTAFVQAAIAAESSGVFFSSATIGNVAATETDAYSHILFPGTLAANGDALEFEAAGTIAGTVSVDKQIRVYFGATIVFDSGLLAITVASDWHLQGSIVRTGLATEKIVATLTTNDGTIQAIADYDTAAENLALAQTVKLTLNGTNANDVVAELYRDRFVAA